MGFAVIKTYLRLLLVICGVMLLVMLVARGYWSNTSTFLVTGVGL